MIFKTFYKALNKSPDRVNSTRQMEYFNDWDIEGRLLSALHETSWVNVQSNHDQGVYDYEV